MRTFTDQVQQVADSFTEDNLVLRVGRQARAAVRAAYRDIATRQRWNYLLKPSLVNTVAPFNTGTVQFTYATRTMTLTGGTWPAWAQSGILQINRNQYAVKIMVDSTHLIMDPLQMPSGDLPSGTGFVLVQMQYPLPSDFVEVRALVEIERLWYITYKAPEDMLRRQQMWFAPSEILFYTIVGGLNGAMNLLISPPPASAKTYTLLYQGRPRLLSLTGMQGPFRTGRATFTSGSQVVNFSGGTVLPQNIEKCVLRIGTSTLEPSSEIDDFPYLEEHVVLERNSDTQLTMYDAAGANYTNYLFTLDDPIDIEPVSMLTLFDRMCEHNLNKLMQTDVQRLAYSARQETDAYRLAIGADSRLIPSALTAPGMTDLYDGFWSVTPHGPM